MIIILILMMIPVYCVLYEGRDHKEQDCGIVSLNCQELLIILILMMILMRDMIVYSQRARLRYSESELPGITDHPDMIIYSIKEGRDHKEQDSRKIIVSLNCQELLIIQDCGIVSLNCQELLIILILMMILHQGRDHKEQDYGIVSLNCQELLIILILMMIKEEITKSKIAG